jgi:Fe-S-cluster containining protein
MSQKHNGNIKRPFLLSGKRIKSLFSKTKIGRFINSYVSKQAGRKGSCTPDVCETLDGQKGAACCKLGYRCPALSSSDSCKAYKIRPRNCRVFPNNEDDLKLVKNCGYYF